MIFHTKHILSKVEKQKLLLVYTGSCNIRIKSMAHELRTHECSRTHECQTFVSRPSRYRIWKGWGNRFPHTFSCHELFIESTTAAHGGQGNANLLMDFEVTSEFGGTI